MQERIATKNIGRKFNEDGSVRFFPGNTVISKIHEDSEIYPLIREIRQSFVAAMPEKYAYLPEASFHMTVIQGVCDEDRKPELWTSRLSLEAPLVQVDDFFEKQFAQVRPLGHPRMVFDRVDTANDIIIVRFKPAGIGDQEKLKAYRDQIADLFGIRFPDHDCYGFHVSVAYKLWKLTEAEEKTVEEVRETWNARCKQARPSFSMPDPELTFFYHMFEFCSERIAR